MLIMDPNRVHYCLNQNNKGFPYKRIGQKASINLSETLTSFMFVKVRKNYHPNFHLFINSSKREISNIHCTIIKPKSIIQMSKILFASVVINSLE